jgi:serine/threonine-protein kinase RsbW
MTTATSRQPYRADFVLRNDRSEIEAAERNMLQEIEQQQFDKASLFAVRLSLEEALSNAFKHGNKNDPAKTVRMRCEINSHAIAIDIQDEGQGFDPDAVPDPTDNENVEIPCGRGLKLIRSFMHEVEIKPPGNRITMKYVRP